MKKRYMGRLNIKDREGWEDRANRRRKAAYRGRHDQNVLRADEGKPACQLIDRQLAERVEAE
ncbi:conserved hypothetical protein [Candidatus Methylobacter favarea]|uniref:Uncharacterized protein n=1 Tax=Candidatus Methylobacter favarea TaxID=2707345 RepID=A0A8S0XJ12_9GAMM|nr:hypothetical protein [Candidatus Methylobacter favarea]CAA9892833.1 conserved hypothetical protein [Candidatus Methylobacter favarea]